MKNTSLLTYLPLSILYLFYSSSSLAQGNTYLYEYRLESGIDKEVCRHMTEVFNRDFRMPWDRGDRYFGTSPNPIVFGKPLDQAYERLAGVEFERMKTYKMLLSRYPSSPEFDAIKWREGRYHDSQMSFGPKDRPILVSEIDIDNDGRTDWLVKYSFMFKMPTNVVHGVARDHDYSGQDNLAIYPSDGFDISSPLQLDQLTRGQNPNLPPRVINDADGLQFRPFIYKGNTYLSAYQVVWYDKNINHKRPKRYQIYPDLEYMNILRVLPGGKRYKMSLVEAANTDVVCRIRMTMLNDAYPLKGN